jgi:hypothetical protein
VSSDPFARQVIATFDRCVYCGRSDLPLSDEHVVPFGINGPWVIANASCPNCAKITGRFEQQVQKGQLLMARTALKLKTRNPKQRPTTFPLYVRGTLKHVPIEEHAPLIVLQPFAAPSHHAGREHTPGRMTIAGELLIIHAGGLAPPFLNRKHGPGNWGFRIAFDAFAFPRLMAKIGHCLAAVALGLNGFEPWACPAMLSPIGDLGRWVGCLPAPFVNGATGLHEVSIRVVGDEAHAFVRLFAQLGAQEYFVVVGKLTPRGKSAVESAMTLVAARDDQMR